VSGGASLGLVGTLLNERYRVESALGEGGMASVLLARDTRLERRVVIKIPRLDGLGDPAQRRRFLAEIHDLSAFEHPSILAILDQGEHEGMPFAVLQYLSGGDLAQRLRAGGGQESPAQILEWLLPIARALDFIHARGRLHRDVKAGNILFDEDDHPYLSDFGIATALDVVDADAPTVEAGRDQLTRVGTFIGSPAYAPPEAIDRVFTPAYDQYSLATVVYLALCGALPFRGRTHEAILVAKTQNDPLPLRSIDPSLSLPEACSGVLEQALARDPEERFASCGEFADAFERACGSASRSSPRAIQVRHVARLVAAAAGVAALLLLWPRSTGWMEDARIPAPGGRQAELGSSETDRAAALELCRAHGSFCDPEELAGERPHRYTARPILMDRFEVTNARFAEFVAATDLSTLAEERGYSWDGPTRRRGLSWRKPAATIEAAPHPDWPVTHVTFEEARTFCRHLEGRLPSADEWEYQARGVERRRFPWGDDWDASRLRFSETLALGLEPVGSHPTGATPEGVQDLAGSVWEWTEGEGESGPVLKGGSWDTRNPAHFRSAAIGAAAADETSSDIGFRCVWDG